MLAQVDWQPVINAVKRVKQREDLKSIHIEVALPQEIRKLRDYYQHLIESSRILPDSHPLTRNLDRVDSIHKSIPDSVRDLIVGMTEGSIYSDTQISDACNIYLSYIMCHIGSYLATPDKYPSLMDLEDISAFVFEYKKNELLVLEFASYPDRSGRRRSVKGVVPRHFLNSCKNLSKWVERVRGRYRAPQAGVDSIFQLFPHAFEILFTPREKVELWSHYVLPISLCRYPKEALIFSPFEVEVCGLP